MAEISTTPLQLENVGCCICGTEDATPLATGEDFEYRSSLDTFVAMRCRRCEVVYLNPRPALAEFTRIYPAHYHAFAFTAEDFGFIYRVRRRLEARRLLNWCQGLPADARIIDIGCGDGFHLAALRDFGQPGWRLEGVDGDARAVARATAQGLNVQLGFVESLALPAASFDLALLIQTVEHVADPVQLLRVVRSLLRPGGKVVIVTDNTDALDFALFKGRYWGGYHFPRHWYLFNQNSMRRLAQQAGLEVAGLATAVSPVNWTYSLHNALVDFAAPQWLRKFFSLQGTAALGAFTLFDICLQKLGRGALLNAILRRPVQD